MLGMNESELLAKGLKNNTGGKTEERKWRALFSPWQQLLEEDEVEEWS